MPHVIFRIYKDMHVFLGDDGGSAKFPLTPEEELPIDEITQYAQDYLKRAWKKNRSARRSIESCTAYIGFDHDKLKVRRDAKLVTVHRSSDVVYVYSFATCINCGWRDNVERFSGQESPFYCSSIACQNVRRERAKEVFVIALQAEHAAGKCGFQPYYQRSCTQPSISELEPFCEEHQGKICKDCDKQAVGEQGWSGSLNYFYPYCEDHWFTPKQW